VKVSDTALGILTNVMVSLGKKGRCLNWRNLGRLFIVVEHVTLRNRNAVNANVAVKGMGKEDQVLSTFCVNCRCYLPNVLKKFKCRFVPRPRCVEGAGIPDVPSPDEVKEIKWNPQEKGCDKFEVFID